MAAQVMIECFRCQGCGNVTSALKRICPKCGGTDIEPTPYPAAGTIVDSTVINYPPSHYQDIAPYTSILVRLGNGARVFGVMEGSQPDLPIGAAVTAFRRDEARGGFFFRLDDSNSGG